VASGSTGPSGGGGTGSLKAVAPSSNHRQADLGDDEDPDDGYDIDDEVDGAAEADVKPSLATRFLKSLEGPAVKGNTKRAVEQLDDRERLYSFVASGLAVVLGLLIYFIESDNKHFRLAKGQLTPQTTLAVGLISGALLFGATWLGRRAPVGFISLFAFLFFGTRYFVGVPFLLLGVWLLYHSYKVQKEANALRKANRSTGTAAPDRSSGSKAPPTKADRTSRANKGPARPEANKRYTPKRPPPPAPKPSRRERKATKASD
jgi:hypothetical protein